MSAALVESEDGSKVLPVLQERMRSILNSNVQGEDKIKTEWAVGEEQVRSTIT